MRVHKKILGVCGGIGEYLGIDSTIVRIAFVLFLGLNVLLYLVLAIIMPDQNEFKKLG